MCCSHDKAQRKIGGIGIVERVYYAINESAARTAHSMMSFSDYQEGRKQDGRVPGVCE